MANTLPAARWPLFKHVAHVSCAPVVFLFVIVAHVAPQADQAAVNPVPPMFLCSQIFLHFLWEVSSNGFVCIIACHLRASHEFHILLQSQVAAFDEIVLHVASEQDRPIESHIANANKSFASALFGFALFAVFHVNFGTLCTRQLHESMRGAFVVACAGVSGKAQRIITWLGRRRSRWRSTHAIPDVRQ